MDAICRHKCYILHIVRNVSQFADVGRKGTVGSLCNGENSRIGLSVTTVRVVVMNSTDPVRLEGAAQG